MNILVLSWRDPKHPLAGGAEQVMHEHMKGWVNAGNEVTLFSSYFKGSKKEEIYDGIKIIRSGRQLLDVHIRAFFWYLSGNHPKFDLVVDQFHGIPFFTPIYIRVPKLAVIQEVAKDVWLRNSLIFPFNWMIGLIGYFIEPLSIIALYKNIPFMTGSQSTKKDLTALGIPEKNITIVPHGVILESVGRTSREKIKTVVFLGALTKDKGIKDALDAFSIINKNGKFNFWVIGKGGDSYVKYLKGLAQQLGLEGRIKWFGFVTQRKKFELLAKSHIMINPSLREGWGLVNIEANSVGVPIVAYNSVGLTDSVQDGISGVIVQKNTPKALAGKVVEIIDNKKMYDKLSEGAKKWSENFDWKKSTNISLGLISKLEK